MESNSCRIKWAHESSDLDKEVSFNIPEGRLENELQIVPAKQSVGVLKKVTSKKGKRGKEGPQATA